MQQKSADKLLGSYSHQFTFNGPVSLIAGRSHPCKRPVGGQVQGAMVLPAV